MTVHIHEKDLWIWDNKKEAWICGCGDAIESERDKLSFRKYDERERALAEEAMERVTAWNRQIYERWDSDSPSPPTEEDEREGSEPEERFESVLRFEGGDWAGSAEPESIRKDRKNPGNEPSRDSVRGRRRRKS